MVLYVYDMIPLNHMGYVTALNMQRDIADMSTGPAMVGTLPCLFL